MLLFDVADCRVQFRPEADEHEGIQGLGHTVRVPADPGVC